LKVHGAKRFPRLYPILDAELVLREVVDDRVRRQALLRRVVAELADAGVEILQYRNKQDADETVAEDARGIREAAGGMKLILNDRVALAARIGWDGVHVGQEDLPAREARKLVGPAAWVGLSTHNETQLRAANLEPVNYIAIGPVFATPSKANPDPVIGLEGVRRARLLTEQAPGRHRRDYSGDGGGRDRSGRGCGRRHCGDFCARPQRRPIGKRLSHNFQVEL
jgi:thiamine-phosphate pyrophosphorylase